VTEWPLTSDFHLNHSTFNLQHSTFPKVLFLCSPNNPTGNNLRREDMIRVIETFPGIVVVDEAYIDFADQASFVPELDRYPNLVVLQTFSKSYGLAGIRLGLAFASEALISWMLRVKAPYNINKLTTEVALRALEQKETLRTSVELLNQEREKVALALAGIPAVKKVHPSDSNFILAVVDNAYSVYKTMADAGVVIRYRGDQLHCDSTVRITIGTPDENERMLAMLREVTS